MSYNGSHKLFLREGDNHKKPYQFPDQSQAAIEGMLAQAMQYFTYLVPLRYFLEIVRSIFLKGTGPAAWWPQLLLLAGFGVLTFGFSALMFKKRLD